MGWVQPIDFYDDDPFTAAQWNTFVTDNLLACGPGVAADEGQLLCSGGKNVVVPRSLATKVMRNTVTLTTEWPSDPDNEEDVGPTIKFAHGGSFLLLYDVLIRKVSGTGHLNYGPEITDGPGVLPDVYNLAVRRQNVGGYIRTGAHCLVTGVEAGVTTVTMKYGATPGDGAIAAGTYADRRLTVLTL